MDKRDVRLVTQVVGKVPRVREVFIPDGTCLLFLLLQNADLEKIIAGEATDRSATRRTRHNIEFIGCPKKVASTINRCSEHCENDSTRISFVRTCSPIRDKHTSSEESP